jgi:uncharacterized protein (TIGR03083 family)
LWGPTKASSALGLRVFDCYAHEQDVRRALGRPGNLDGVAAHVTVERIGRGLAPILAEAGVPGVEVVVDLSGERHAFPPDGAVATTVTMPFETLVLLFCGRADVDRSAVSVDGDAEVANAALEALWALTP